MKKRNRVYQRLDNDYKEFRKEMISMSSEELFDKAYKIFCINEFYFILANAYEYTHETIAFILGFKGNILEQIYDEWIDSDYALQEEFKTSIKDTLNAAKAA